MNSLDFDAHEAQVDVWREFDADDSARVGVITGAGDKAFCAGADLKTYTMSFATRPPHEFRRKWVDGVGLGGIARGMEIDKPLIAAVNGFAISGGLEIALACDLRFCSDNPEFALQDSKWGFHACDGGLVRLPMIVGLGNAMGMILSGEGSMPRPRIESASSTVSGRRPNCWRRRSTTPRCWHGGRRWRIVLPKRRCGEWSGCRLPTR